jgi:hypothetical protein
MLRWVSLLVVVLALAAPAGALAQSDPFSPLPPAQTAPTPTPVAPTSSGDDDGGLKGWQEILIIAAGVCLLLGIGWAIVGDARSRLAGSEGGPGRAEARARREADHKRRKTKARAAGKRSRAARRRNR